MCSVVAQISGETVKVLDEIVIPQGDDGGSVRGVPRSIPAPLGGHTRLRRCVRQPDADDGTNGLPGDPGFLPQGRLPSVSYCAPKANPLVRDRVELVNAKLRNAAGETNLFIQQTV